MRKIAPSIICILLKREEIRRYIVYLRVEGDIIYMKVRVPDSYKDIKNCISKYSIG